MMIGLLLLLCGSAVAAAPQRYNFVFMMADQMRFDAMSHVSPSQRAFRTPALDRIAAEGLSVEFSWSSTPTCTPARAAILTGQSPWNHGMLGYGSVAKRYPVEFPRLVAERAGFVTAAFGKNHFGWVENATDDHGIRHGYAKTSLYDGLGSFDTKAPGGKNWTGEFDDYDQWFQREKPGFDPQATLDYLDGNGWNSWHGAPYIYDESLHPTKWVGDQAVAFIHGQAAARKKGAVRSAAGAAAPFLVKVSFHRPHSPYDPPARLLDAVDASDLPAPIECKAAAATDARRASIAAGGAPAPPHRSPVAPPPAADDSGHGDGWCLRFRGDARAGDAPGCGPSNADAWCGQVPPVNATLSRRAYAASVNFVDEQVGRVYDALHATGLLNTTFVLFTSDHGDGQGSHYHWRKGYPYEFSAHVPMLLRWPEAWEQEQQQQQQGQGHQRRRKDLLAGGNGAACLLPRGTVIKPPLVSELRDVFHTVVDAAGLGEEEEEEQKIRRQGKRHFAAEDGKSLLCLVKQETANCSYALNPGPWRQWIDMEHSTCYNATNHWSALTDGKTKYVFRAWKGDEQLFDLVADPDETTEISGLPSSAATLARWRARLVAQFEAEGRGKGWVKDGKLVKRTAGTTYSPNYPKEEHVL